MGENRPNDKWSDHAEEEYATVHTTEEMDKLLIAKGLPHSRSHEFRAEAAKEPHPEIPENADPIYEEGISIGRANRGRGGLPKRLQAS